MRTAIITLTLALLTPTVAMSEPQRQTYRDASGREIGRSTTDARGNTTFRDSMSRNTGRSVTHGNTTITYDAMGRQMGTVTSKGR